MNSDLRAFLESLPEDTPDVDAYVVESILEQCAFMTNTECIVWTGSTRYKGYPVYNSVITGTLGIRPFLYRVFIDSQHNYESVNRLRLKCNTKGCVSPYHLIPVKVNRALAADFASRHKRVPREQTNGRV